MSISIQTRATQVVITLTRADLDKLLSDMAYRHGVKGDMVSCVIHVQNHKDDQYRNFIEMDDILQSGSVCAELTFEEKLDQED